jgi:hypothetical protein
MENELDPNLKLKMMIIGGVVGAAVGVGAAYIYVRKLEESGEKPSIATKEAVAVGFSLVSLLRQIANMGS